MHTENALRAITKVVIIDVELEIRGSITTSMRVFGDVIFPDVQSGITASIRELLPSGLYGLIYSYDWVWD